MPKLSLSLDAEPNLLLSIDVSQMTQNPQNSFCLVSVCHIWHIHSLFVNRKDWFRASPFNDGITVSWKLKPCHLSLSENRPCTIK